MRLACLALLIVAAPAAAHDFWIDLPRYHQPADTPVALRFLIGDKDVEPWETLWRNVVSLRDYGPAGVTDLQAGIRPQTTADSGGATITLAGIGTHVIAFESAIAENDIAADDFNNSARHEGVTPALEARKAAGTEATRDRETYSRRAKALVQVSLTFGD